MATDTRNLPAHLAGDANFRTWGSGLAAQFAAVGLVQTADTGQVDWASVARPGAINTFAGYEIWRFADSLQATAPVFVKIQYGVAGAVDRPRLGMTVSTATDGAGTPTGQVGTARIIAPTASKTAGAVLPSYCAGSTSRLNLCTNLDATTTTFAMALWAERTKTASGTDTGDAIITYSSATSPYQLIPFTGTIPGAATANPALDHSAGGLTASGSDVLLAPTVAFYGKPLFASWCAYRVVDAGITELTTLASVNHFGATHTYMPLGDGWTLTSHTLGAVSGYAIAMLWE